MYAIVLWIFPHFPVHLIGVTGAWRKANEDGLWQVLICWLRNWDHLEELRSVWDAIEHRDSAKSWKHSEIKKKNFTTFTTAEFYEQFQTHVQDFINFAKISDSWTAWRPICIVKCSKNFLNKGSKSRIFHWHDLWMRS